MSNTNAFLVKLGYDPSDAKTGLKQALSDLNDFKVQAAQVNDQLVKEQIQSTTQFTAANKSAAQERLKDIQSEIASTTGSMARKSAAEKAALAESLAGLREQYAGQKQVIEGFAEHEARVVELKNSYADLRSQILGTRAAVASMKAASGDQQNVFQKALGGVSLGNVLQATGILGLGASIPFAIHALGEGLKSQVEGAGEYAQSMQLAAEKTGATISEMQRFDVVGRAVGLTSEDMVTSMRKFSAAIIASGEGARVGMAGVAESAGKAGSIMSVLGINVKDSSKNYKSTYDILLQLADAFQKLPDGATKSAVAVELLGRSGLNMIPFLDKGSSGVKELLEKFDGLLPDLTGAAGQMENLRIAEAEYELSSKALV